MIGAGRMGAGLARRMNSAGLGCVVFDPDTAAVDRLRAEGIDGVGSLSDLVAALSAPRVIWVMVPAALTDAVIADLRELLGAGDVVIDGGNSFYRDDVRRARELAVDGIDYIDVGTSGGVHGIERGFCLMIGGSAEVVERLDPLFVALAPGVDSAPRTPGRVGAIDRAERGYLHCGPAGAGHFVKMVHNGIEYGQMAALAEGMAILREAGFGTDEQAGDAETAPVSDASYYTYDFDIAAVVEVWRRGSVVSSWLVDLTAGMLHGDPGLEEFSGRVSDSGEGRWTVQAAVDEGVPAHVLTAALYSRFASRGEDEYVGKALSAMRKAFGGHNEKVVCA